MTKLRKFWSLNRTERHLLCRAGYLLLLADVGLRLFPFRRVLNWAQKDCGRKRAAHHVGPEQVAWLVEAAARRMFLRPTCLRKSLVLLLLLKEQGHDARLMIGTTSGQDGFRAHAWVEMDGKVLGGLEEPGFTALASFGSGVRERQLA